MKNETVLLGSGGWYFVDIKQGDKTDRIVIDEKEYQIVLDGLNSESGKFIKVGRNHYFWSKIDSFGPIEFDEGVLAVLRDLPDDTQDYIKKRIRSGQNISTLERLRSEVSFFISTRE